MVIWPWSWIFKVKFWKCCISGMEGPIDMERKRCESIGCYTHFVTLFPSPMTLTLNFQGQILKKSYLRNGMADWHGIKGMWIDKMLDPCCDFKCPPHPWSLPWIFKVKLWKSRISGKGWPFHMERNGCESIGCYTHFVFLPLSPPGWRGIVTVRAAGRAGGRTGGRAAARLAEPISL